MTDNMPDEITIEIPGAVLAARCHGRADGSPVLALHGWQDSAATFDLLAPKLPRHLRVVAVDLSGHGRSSHHPVGCGYTFLDWVVEVHDATRALGWSRFAVLGHSLGAGIANALAATWPDEVSQIIAIDGFAPRFDGPSSGPERLAEHASLRRRIATRKARTFATREAAATRLAERVRGLTLDGARVLVSRGTHALEDGTLTWSRDPQIQAGPPIRLDREQIRGFLCKVTCPVVLIRPDKGWPVSAGTIDFLREHITNLAIANVAGGHHVHLENVDEVAAIVTDSFE